MSNTSSGFWFVFLTPLYEETVAFYRDDLGFALIRAWDRGPDNKGAIFEAGSGCIEIILSDKPFTAENFSLMIEVDDADQFHQLMVEKQIPVLAPPENKPWGHRSFTITDPNGIRLALFSPLDPA